jgi:cytochrome b
MSNNDNSFPRYMKFTHAGLAIFGITAFLTAELAENGSSSMGYYLHAALGFSVVMFVIARIFAGMSGTGHARFSGWSPFSSRQWRRAWQDVGSLVRLRVPERGVHQGLPGLVQAFGLGLFATMGITGTGLFLLEGIPDDSLFHTLEEIHEAGEGLIPLYLLLHIGPVVVHSVAGKPIWQRMWKLG